MQLIYAVYPELFPEMNIEIQIIRRAAIRARDVFNISGSPESSRRLNNVI